MMYIKNVVTTIDKLAVYYYNENEFRGKLCIKFLKRCSRWRMMGKKINRKNLANSMKKEINHLFEWIKIESEKFFSC